jgi:coenzyme F420 biosynthesis associated uncharacterized protein
MPSVAPAAELVDRRAWSRMALATLADASAPLERTLAGEISLRGPLARIVRGLLGVGTGAEAGLAVGYAARRVLGQYDVAIFGEFRPGRLLLVAPNLEATARELDADRDLFLRWVALHETTHVLQLDGVPWLLPHLRALAARLVKSASVELEPSHLSSLAKRFVREPREFARAVLRGELARLLSGPAARAVFDRLQATMAVVEGHAEHVMDACAADNPALGDLRAKMDSRRASRGGLTEAIGRLLGMELKLRQYELGKRFWDDVVNRRGAGALQQVWASAASVPDLAELERPQLWLDRTETELSPQAA